MAGTPGMQRKALDVVLDAARQTDMKHGTKIIQAVWKSIMEGSFKVHP
jgi:hypothetical protein